MRQLLLQSATAILLQNLNTSVYYRIRQVFYYKMRQFYYKMRQLLQIATILLQNTTVITKCDVYYKLRQYNFQFHIALFVCFFVLNDYLSLNCKFHFLEKQKFLS